MLTDNKHLSILPSTLGISFHYWFCQSTEPVDSLRQTPPQRKIM